MKKNVACGGGYKQLKDNKLTTIINKRIMKRVEKEKYLPPVCEEFEFMPEGVIAGSPNKSATAEGTQWGGGGSYSY